MRFSILATPINSELSIAQVQAAHQAELNAIARYCRLTNYLAIAQIYLKDNFLLKEPLRSEHIKDRLLGHWGTCPGINLIYAHLNCLIQHHDISLFLIVEAGHGTPAMLANLYLERSLQAFYPELTLDANGLTTLIRGFSYPYGFVYHHDYAGEELGHALAVAFGTVMDNPDLIVVYMISDGEAETGATPTAWDSCKLIDPAKSGAVLPILYLNGNKASTPVIYGAMSDIELQQRFAGYGYQVRIVGSQNNQSDKDSTNQNSINLNADLYDSLDWAYREICSIQQAARSGQAIAQPKFPLLIVRSPQDRIGIQETDGAAIGESHQIPTKDLKTNPQQLQLLEDWLRSYQIEELFDPQGCPIREILDLCPQDNQRMGCHAHTFEGVYQPLNVPNISDFEIPIQTKSCSPAAEHSNTEQIGKYIKTVIEQNPQTFRIFCPDEPESSNLSVVLEVSDRNDQSSIQSDSLQVSLRKERMLEFFSPHTCQGWLQGYLFTGRHGLFLSHEAALGSIISMMNQHASFLQLSKTSPWRSRSVGCAQSPVASLNYLAISTPCRQECSDVSRQSSSFINAVLTQSAEIVRVYLPPDVNCLLTTIAHCLDTIDQINLIIASPDPMPQWLTMTDAIAHCRAGASIWHWASTDAGINPDVVLIGIGDRSTLEVMAAAQILRDEMPELRVRVVNVIDLRVLEADSQHLDPEQFEALFTCDRPIIINFQGNPAVLKQLLFGRPNSDRFQLNGDRGEAISSFAQNLRHGTSRFHLIIQAIRLAAPHNSSVAARASERVHYYEDVLAQYRLSQQSGGDWASPL